MTTPWTYSGPVPATGAAIGAVTLVEGQTFCLSGRAGDIHPDLAHGLFFLDTRLLSRWELAINGHPLEPLTVDTPEPFTATFVARGRPSVGQADANIVVFRSRHVGRGMRERLVVRNFGLDPAPIALELRVDADFANLFAVKEGRAMPSHRPLAEVEPMLLRFRDVSSRVQRDVTIALSEEAIVEPGLATWRMTLPAQSSWELCLEAAVALDGIPVEARFRCGEPDEEAVPSQRLTTWRRTLPQLATDHDALHLAVRQSAEDLGALRIFDPEHPDRAIVAAGAPWFMTVFGRDSLITAWMALLVDPDLAQGVLETLARFQGNEINPETEEAPGKILHEMRFDAAAGLALGGGDIYYGTADATPLFVMLLGELRRWGLAEDVVERLLPHADRALEWIAQFGDRDGDGYVEYRRSTPEGLFNQGWKDSWDGVRFADGRLPQPPIALCEVQAYVYAAYVARAHFAEEAGDAEVLETYRKKAQDLKEAFNRDFWLDEHGWYALGLDAAKRPIDALASNVGHCLWTGIVDEERAPLIAARLAAPEMFSGWGIRTLATSMAAYNPVSYHNGSVWPHDTALCVAGLMRYGFVEEAHQVIEGLLAVAGLNGGRLPELFAGFDRSELGRPAAYPTSCVPQAWAAAAPLLMLRCLLRLDPWVSHNRVYVSPVLPPSIGRLRLEGIRLGDHEVTVDVRGSEFSLEGAEGLEVITEPRHPVSAAVEPPRASSS